MNFYTLPFTEPVINDNGKAHEETFVSKLSIVPLNQGFSNFFLEGPDEIPMKPQRAGT